MQKLWSFDESKVFTDILKSSFLFLAVYVVGFLVQACTTCLVSKLIVSGWITVQSYDPIFGDNWRVRLVWSFGDVEAYRLVCHVALFTPNSGKGCHSTLLKFNLDALIEGSYGEASFGGILRNNIGNTLLKIWLAISQSDPIAVELQEILKACLLWQASEWKDKFEVIIESNCQLVVKWASNECQCPDAFAELVGEFNYAAHVLAKQGIGRKTELVWDAEV
ncbi:hypothetical protein GQ457_05G026590 [Hibiscus cannabinus]